MKLESRQQKKLIILGVRVSDDWLARLDQWISDSDASLSRPEAIRRLVDLGLGNNEKISVRPKKLKEFTLQSPSVELPRPA
jgi:hypothetical protein